MVHGIQSSEYGYGKLETLTHYKVKWSFVQCDTEEVLDYMVVDKTPVTVTS